VRTIFLACPIGRVARAFSARRRKYAALLGPFQYRADAADLGDSGEAGRNIAGKEAILLRWGLIPEWATEPGIGNMLINARSETAAQKPAFRASLRRRRCLIAADGFYEWKTEGRTKQPYFIHFFDDRPFAFAGLWDRWEGPDHSAVESCTILTTDANELMKPIHQRMPVILDMHHYEKWLDPAEQDAARVLPLLQPYFDRGLEASPVGRAVNSPRHEGPDCLTPSRAPKSLFD
jgi:putative SOS response-associated peptidase YedK